MQCLTKKGQAFCGEMETGMEKTMEQIQELIEMVGEMTEEQFRWFTDQVQRELFYKGDQPNHREDLK